MDDIQKGVSDAARASFDAIRNGTASPLLQKRNSGAAVTAVASGVVDLLTERAAGAAAGVIQDAPSAASSLVWNDVLAMLADCGLSPVLYCAKSGRRLGVIDPSPWSEYLGAIANMGADRAADDCLARLLGAIVTQKAHTVAPVVLVTSADNLAMIRDTCPPDFLCRALGDLFPMPRGAQSLELAQRAEMLGRARAAITCLPAGAVAYACEVVTLYLSYIAPTRLDRDLNPVAAYGVGGLADLVAPFQSVATLGHFCARLVQSMLRLIASAKLRPVDKLRPQDLASLSVHWQGLEQFKRLKKGRAKIKAARVAADRVRMARVSGSALRSFAALSDANAGFLDDFAGALLTDALALSTASGVAGKPLPVQLDSELAAQAAMDKRQELELLRAQKDEFDAMENLFDVSELVAAGAASGFVTEVDDDDWQAFGPVDFDPFADFGSFDDDDDPLDDDDAETVLPDWLLAAEMEKAQARQSIRKVAAPKPPKPVNPAVAAAMAALNGAPDPAPAASGAPVMRRVVSAAPVAPVAPAAPATPSPAPVVIRRRVL